MKQSDLTQYADLLKNSDFAFHSDLFSKPIWGDMGEDVASITISAAQGHWKLSYIRTQNGEPYPLADTVSNLIDRYEKELSEEGLYDYLSMHRLLPEFELAIQQHQQGQR